MRKAIPWGVRGGGVDVQDAARKAARREGINLSEWLAQVVGQYAAQTGADPADLDEDDCAEAIATQLRRLGIEAGKAQSRHDKTRLSPPAASPAPPNPAPASKSRCSKRPSRGSKTTISTTRLLVSGPNRNSRTSRRRNRNGAPHSAMRLPKSPCGSAISKKTRGFSAASKAAAGIVLTEVSSARRSNICAAMWPPSPAKCRVCAATRPSANGRRRRPAISTNCAARSASCRRLCAISPRAAPSRLLRRRSAISASRSRPRAATAFERPCFSRSSDCSAMCAWRSPKSIRGDHPRPRRRSQNAGQQARARRAP